MCSSFVALKRMRHAHHSLGHRKIWIKIGISDIEKWYYIRKRNESNVSIFEHIRGWNKLRYRGIKMRWTEKVKEAIFVCCFSCDFCIFFIVALLVIGDGDNTTIVWRCCELIHYEFRSVWKSLSRNALRQKPSPYLFNYVFIMYEIWNQSVGRDESMPPISSPNKANGYFHWFVSLKLMPWSTENKFDSISSKNGKFRRWTDEQCTTAHTSLLIGSFGTKNYLPIAL